MAEAEADEMGAAKAAAGGGLIVLAEERMAPEVEAEGTGWNAAIEWPVRAVAAAAKRRPVLMVESKK